MFAKILGLGPASADAAASRNGAEPLSPRQIADALEILGRSEPDASRQADGPPVFVLSVAWRCGSTLLQRVLMTDERLLVWGEPFGRMALVPKITESLSAVCSSWPREKDIITNRDGNLSESWVANLYPPTQSLHRALRDFAESLWKTPAIEQGYSRWGLKEVRLGAADACVLHWLFPDARFLVLIRDPRDAYRSGKKMNLWQRWPDRKITTPADFAEHWAQLAASWQALPPEFPARIIRFEDLVSRQTDFRSLEQWLDVKLDEERALSVRVRGSSHEESLSRHESRVIERTAAAELKTFGYA